MSLKSLSVKIGADTSGFSEGIRSINDGIKKIASSALALVSVTATVKGLVQAFQAYTSLESSINRVTDLFADSARYIQYFCTDYCKIARHGGKFRI